MQVDTLQKKLQSAQGRSEFVIAVVCDIRGFSEFSTHHESPDTAMFIKRFYLQLLGNYFVQAAFVKPTGDGMLMTFSYNENTLIEVSKYVLSSCFQAISDFPKMFAEDPMINFATPQHLGFGISRGPACCLYSGRDTIDYSGHVLNLAARLNDVARPQGVVIDGQYLLQSIPKEYKDKFKQENIYIRSIAEQASRSVFVSSDVVIPNYARFPMNSDKWEAQEFEIAVAKLEKISSNFSLPLQHEAKSPDKIIVNFICPHPKLKGYTTSREYQNVKYLLDAKGPKIRMSLDQAKQIINEEKLSGKTKVKFDIQFVPKKMT